MADNIELNAGSGGQIIRALDDGTAVHPVGVTAFATTVGTPDVVSIVTPTAGLPVRLTDGSGYLATLPVSLASVPSHAVTGPLTDAELRASAVPVSAASLPLPSGAATAANQTTANASLATLAGAVSGTEVQVDVLTMPTVTISDGGGAITVDGTVAVTGTFWQATQPVSLASVPSHDVTNAGTFAVQAAQSGDWAVIGMSGDPDSVTYLQNAGTPYVGGTYSRMIQWVSLRDSSGNEPATATTTPGGSDRGLVVRTAGAVAVTDNSGSLTVDNAGTFAVQAAQSGTWNITNVSGTISLPTGAATAAKQPALGTAGTASADVLTVQGIASMTPLLVNGSGVTQPVSGTVTAELSATDNAVLDAIAASLAGTLTVTGGGGGTQYTEGDTDATITGTAILWEDTGNTLRPVSASTPLPISDAGGAITVDGTVTANAGTGTFAVSAASLPLPSGAATLAEQQSQTTALQLIDDAVATVASAITTKGIAAVGTDGTNARILKTDASGELQVDVLSMPTTTVTGTVAATQSGTWTVTGTGGTFPVTDSGGSLTVDAPVGTPVFVRLSDGASAISTLPVSLASVPSHAVTNAGTFAVQAAQSGTWNVGTVTTLTTCSTVTTVSTLTGGGVAHDNADSGNPVKIGAKAVATPSTATMVAAADRTDATSDLDGALLVRLGSTYGDLISERVTDTGGTSTAFTNFGATASTRNYVTAITVYNSSATAGYVDIRDGTAGSVLYTIPLPAGGGAVLTQGGAPLFRSSANTALAYDVSGALSTVYISMTGFKSKV